MTIGQYLKKSVQTRPTKEALVCGSNRFSYEALSKSADSLACFFRQRGLNVGDRVAVFLDNSPEAVIAIFGIMQAGGALVYINSGTTTDRLGYILQNCSPRFIIASSLKSDFIKDAEAKCASPPSHILVGSEQVSENAYRFVDACGTIHKDDESRITADDIAAIIYTSGSTGKPKGVTLTHRNFDIVTDAVGEYLDHTPDDRILNFLPLSISYGLLQIFVTFRTGGTLVLEKGFGYPYEIIKKLKDEKITGFAGVPTVYSIITNLKLEGESFPSLRYITNAAAAMPYSFIPKLRKIFPTTKIYLMHGLTECMRTTYLPPDQIEKKPTSVGTGMKHVDLWIEDMNGNRLSAGEVGELVVCGPNIMKGYWNDPEATSQVLKTGRYSDQRVLHTGDLFRLDEEGYFYYVSRMDDVIKSRGKKISPLEIENVIYLCNDVLEVRVLGVPDTLLGQAIKAEVVLKTSALLTSDQIKSHCQKNLEDFQIPQIVEFVQSLPKSAGGKIRRIA